MAAGSKARIETAAAELMAREGYAGMALKDISESSGLPYGSIYHHFPGGKEQIAAAAITSTGDGIASLLEDLVADGVHADAVHRMFGFMADRLEQSDWSDGCVVGTPTLDGAATSASVREACGAAFAAMAQPIVAALQREGHHTEVAEQLGSTLLAAYEGATVLARAQRSRLPIDRAAQSMVLLLESQRP